MTPASDARIAPASPNVTATIAARPARTRAIASASREAASGTEFVYKTGETNLIGEIVMAATRKPLAGYLSEKIWSKVGMEQDAYWITSGDGKEMGGCCLSISLRDYGRYALFFLGGAKSVVAPDWTRQATTATPFLNWGGCPQSLKLPLRHENPRNKAQVRRCCIQ